MCVLWELSAGRPTQHIIKRVHPWCLTALKKFCRNISSRCSSSEISWWWTPTLPNHCTHPLPAELNPQNIVFPWTVKL